MKILQDSYRHDILQYLDNKNNIGIELGVAQGVFAERLLSSNKFRTLFGVDSYNQHPHNTDEYARVLKNIGLDERYKLLRLSFDEAVKIFPDNYFDFIYIDGFAHSGQEGGKTLIDWYKKLKVGGIFSGDDYHADWPLVKWAVNGFVEQIEDVELLITDTTEEIPFCRYPSWFFIKKNNKEINFEKNNSLIIISSVETFCIKLVRLIRWHFTKIVGAILAKIGLKEKVKNLLKL